VSSQGSSSVEHAGVAPAAAGRTVIAPSAGWQAVNIRELWRFRELIYFLVWRDVKVRYKQTVLGAAWAVLQPTLLMIVFVFLGKMTKVPGAGEPVFIYAGMLPWTFFATAMASAGNSLVNSERLITRIYFPRLAVPLAAVGAAIVDFIIASGVLLIMMVWQGKAPGISILMAPIIFALIVIAATGIGTLLAALTVAYRDFRYVIPFLVNFLLIATPTVFWPVSQESLRLSNPLIAINPMSGLIASFRSAMFNEPIPWPLLAVNAAVVLVVLVLACFYFRRVEDTFADIV
jgi:lipopolysaccharide transport system permease protein